MGVAKIAIRLENFTTKERVRTFFEHSKKVGNTNHIFILTLCFLTPHYSFDSVYILLYSLDTTLRIFQLALNTSDCGKDFLLNSHCA